jgi:predicted Zn-dependent protease
MKLGRTDEAASLYIRLQDQEGLQPALQMDLLKALQEGGQTEAGLVLADRMLQDQPNNEFVLSIAAAGQLQKGDAEAALTMYQRILENNPTNTAALRQSGQIYTERGEFERAVPCYLDLVRLDPSPDHYRTLAQLYARQNQAGQTVVFMGQAASLFSSAAVAPWLKNPEFDPVRETVEFRSFADRIIGEEARKAIEAINRRAAEKAAVLTDSIDLPKQPALQLKPNQ